MASKHAIFGHRHAIFGFSPRSPVFPAFLRADEQLQQNDFIDPPII
jgi:hypothetical protein